MAKTYNWGIIGPGRIAHKFAQDLALIPNARLHAVASRSLERAQAFAEQYGAKNSYDNYAEIVDCPDLDVVYVASPHTGHCEHSLLCLEKGIPVLCEKPFALNSREVQKMVHSARNHQVFLMEAIWTRFLPATIKMLEIIKDGLIGEILSVKADFGFKANFDPQSRLFNPALGGGALLDIGIYPCFLANLLLGTPTDIKAMAHLGQTGVDEETGILLYYPGNRMAHLHASLLATTKSEAFIYGEKGTIHLHTRWHEATSLSLIQDGARPQDYYFDFESNGYRFEAEEVMHCLAEGKTESELLPLDFSIQLIKLLGDIREEIGLKYPMD
ncbi:MAG: oxidoreductase [Saprospiraceae bacterium]|nr:MAG: oxidoreductase [Saprospiraceae bacterium]